MATNPSILVIEDSAEDFDMIREGLNDTDISSSIEHLQHSKQAREWLADATSRAVFIILDLNLPGESGIELIKAFKAHPRHASTPLAVLSTSSSPRDIRDSYDAGANTYHVKPLETPQFHDLVSRIAHYWFHDAKTAERLITDTAI